MLHPETATCDIKKKNNRNLIQPKTKKKVKYKIKIK